jgi:squalene-associated FAD-dependent desaturase
MVDGNGRAFDLRCPTLPPPWHLIVGVLRWRALGTRDRLSALRMRRVIDDVRKIGAAAVAAGIPQEHTVEEWLRAHGQSERLCAWLWRPLALAALNQSTSVAAAAPFVRVMGELFGPRAEDSAIGLPRVPLDDLYAEPARNFIEARGGRVLTKSRAKVRATNGVVDAVIVGQERIETASVVSAVPWFALDRIWDGACPPELAPITRSASAMRSSSIVTVNLWFDGPVVTSRFIGLVDGPMHWVFDKSAIVGEGTNHLSIVASGADDLTQMDNDRITGLTCAQLARALPRSRERRVMRSVVVREHRATFSLEPGQPTRPQVETPLSGFYLAGDWVDTGLPGTIESAVQSGHAAAGAMLRRRMADVSNDDVSL